ncbi:MAG: hypothetical protein ACOCX5_04225 [Chloroflexota bacterium]
MAVREDFIDALNICIDRLNAGENIEVIMADYAELANQLRPMLIAGQLMSQARFPADEVRAAELAIEPIIRQTVRQVFGRGLPWIGLGLLLLFIGGGLILFIIVSNDDDQMPGLSNTETSTPTASAQPTSTVTASATPTLTATTTPTATATTPTATATTPTATTTTPTATPAPVRHVTIEGPVTDVSGNIITIFSFLITLDPDDPRLSAIKAGDIIRIRGQIDDNNRIKVIDLSFTSIVVVTNGDAVWRSDDCTTPPPDWAVQFTEEWSARCLTQPTSGTGSTNSGDVEVDDDDDDDDDDGNHDDDD